MIKTEQVFDIPKTCSHKIKGGNEVKTEVVIFSVGHYDMGDNRGLSVRVLGDKIKTNNKFGVEISEAVVPEYSELRYLQSINEADFPAKFKCEISLQTIKAANGKEKTGVALKNLEFLNSMELVDRKVPVKM